MRIDLPKLLISGTLIGYCLHGAAASPHEAALTDQAAPQFTSFPVTSPYQSGTHEIRVVLPDGYDPQKRYRVLYILPVGAGPGKKSALKVFRGLDIANRHDLILVEMTFEKVPWYGDHATNPLVRQESHLRDFVVPWVEEKYSTLGTPEGRLLLGFSKSGWGAFSLILRNPDVFGYAAAWDAPMMLDSFKYGMDGIFGTTEQLAACRPDLLAVSSGGPFKDRTRLVLGGEKLWGEMIPAPQGGSHTVRMHELLDTEGVRHIYRPDLTTPHTWNPAWIDPLVEELLKLTGENPAR
ncbi:MAG: hypothetical protein IAE97_09240 [Chthoniobacterales bacterium]|nr:hypothetical protein [Chthoniobacterales bacterium]